MVSRSSNHNGSRRRVVPTPKKRSIIYESFSLNVSLDRSSFVPMLMVDEAIYLHTMPSAFGFISAAATTDGS